MARLVRRLGRGQRHHLVDDLLAERRNARRPGLVAQQAVDPFRGEASCQRQTQVFDLPVRRMISTVPRPSAVNSTISARQACF